MRRGQDRMDNEHRTPDTAQRDNRTTGYEYRSIVPRGLEDATSRGVVHGEVENSSMQGDWQNSKETRPKKTHWLFGRSIRDEG
jgi:hypothetical protein